MYRIEMFNLSRHEIFFLPTEHSDWTEACTEGQQYVFNRRAENAEILYFRVVDSCNFIPEREEEEEIEYCDGICSVHPEEPTCGVDCDRCPDAWECDDAFYMNRKSIDRDDIDLYKNCLLTQEILNEINRHFNSAYPSRLNHD